MDDWTFPNRLLLIVLCGILLIGCDRGPKIVPVSGTVTYKGKALEFGSVMFQPAQGQPAKGSIQADGTFVMSTFREGDGATVGRNRVRISCYESQAPKVVSEGEQSLGKLLIPSKYTIYDQSGLVVDIKESDNEPIVFELTD